MNNILETILKKHDHQIVGKKCGTVTVSIYKEANSGSHIFYVQSDNDDVLPVSYVIEDALSLY